MAESVGSDLYIFGLKNRKTVSTILSDSFVHITETYTVYIEYSIAGITQYIVDWKNNLSDVCIIHDFFRNRK